MRKTGKTLVLVAMAAVAAGMTSPALAATARHEPVSRSAIAFTPGSGRSVVDWNRELITILGTPGAQPATVHPTRSFALLQAAEYDAVTSITHEALPYLFSVPAPRSARPDASRCSWPRISSSVRGRIRAASGTSSADGWRASSKRPACGVTTGG